MRLFLIAILLIFISIVIKAYYFDGNPEKVYSEKAISTELIENKPVESVQATPVKKIDTVAVNKSDLPTVTSHFRCDGRTHCSQMHSCEEATFFLNNCPDTEMDGDDDRIPCETQWCLIK
ncbi:excalibur calcium-binding domain-containing protein [Sulfuricurvum sp.]|uniref:excalibur calcium-binding domain-containing protein n=1 Tax=Sulfuricurvum sp. TaxID=2025608 RepID=UPI003BAE6B27